MDEIYRERVCALALNAVFGFEPKISRQLADNLGSARAVFGLGKEEIGQIFGPYSKYAPKINDSTLAAAEREYRRLGEEGCYYIAYSEDCYPPLLRECEDPPSGLYVRSASPPEDIFCREAYVSVVGTRDISPYGTEWARRLVGAAAQAPTRPTIVSGFALGVDINAHMAALDNGIPTIAVLPVGIDDVYPRRHRAIAERLAATPGCALVTDYPPGTAAQAFNFLRRNRIIAGMSGSTILVESKLKGGGTMTARLAASYGREVFCLPGRIDDVRSEGCNTLIAEKIAEPIVSLDALPSQLGLGEYSLRRAPDVRTAVERRLASSCTPERIAALQDFAALVRKKRGIQLEELARSLGWNYAEATSAASLLESSGIICVDILQRCSINAGIL